MSAAHSGARMAREKRGSELSVRANKGDASLVPEQLEPGSGEGNRRGEDAIELRDLYRLLEDHAPSWYTEKHHRRAKTGLGRGRAQGQVFLMLYELLEEYAPSWYTSEFQKRAGLTARRVKTGKKAKKRPRPRQ